MLSLSYPNRHFPWQLAFPVLGVPAEPASLPARVTCPACKARSMDVYEDAVLGGQWFWCHACEFRGDALDLGARVWSTSVLGALNRYQRHGLVLDRAESKARRSVERVHGLRGRVDRLWAEASAASPDYSAAWGVLHRVLGVRNPRSPETRWSERGSRFVGHTDRHLVDSAFRPGTVRHRAEGDPRIRRYRATVPAPDHNLFRGPGWKQLLVVPYWDLPGRIRGLLFVGREGELRYRTVWNAQSDETGLAMLPAIVPGPHPEFGAAVLCVTDVRLATRIQLRHLAGSATPLPLVGGPRPSAPPSNGTLPPACTRAASATRPAWGVADSGGEGYFRCLE